MPSPLLYLPFLFTLLRRSLWLFVGAGAVYLSGAVFIEILAGTISSGWPVWYAAHFLGVEYVLLTSIEELLEMGGAILFIYGLLSHMAGQVPVATVRFASELQTEPAGWPRPILWVAGRIPSGVSRCLSRSTRPSLDHAVLPRIGCAAFFVVTDRERRTRQTAAVAGWQATAADQSAREARRLQHSAADRTAVVLGDRDQ
jgi:hypothetical protein